MKQIARLGIVSAGLAMGLGGCASQRGDVAKSPGQDLPPGATLSPDGTTLHVPNAPHPEQLSGLDAILRRQTVTSFRVDAQGRVQELEIPGPAVWPAGQYLVSRAEIGRDGTVKSMSAPNLRPGDCCNLKVEFEPGGMQTLTCSGTCSSGTCHIISYEGQNGGTVYECVCN